VRVKIKEREYLIGVASNCGNFIDNNTVTLVSKSNPMVAELSLLNRVVEILSDAPAPDEILAIALTETEQVRFDNLSEKNELGTLSHHEREELETFLFADHLVGMAKAKAFGKTKNRTVA
jgi:hypothetical protein